MNKYRVIKNYDAVHRMKRVVEGRHWIGDSYNLFGDFYYFRKPNNYDKLISEMPF